MENRKIAIIGDGAVGSTTAYTMMQNDAINEIVILDVNKNKAEGDALDMHHGMSFVSPKLIYAGDYKDVKGSKIIVITAGSPRKPGQTRLDLLKNNLVVFDDILDNLKPYLEEDTIILVVSNPVDIMTYYTYLRLGIDSSRVIGSGTMLDTTRLKSIISEEIGIDPRNIHTFVVGEHGDSEVAAWSVTSISGMPLMDFCQVSGYCDFTTKNHLDELQNKVRYAAHEIISKKGATYYAIALAINKIVEVIVNDQNSVLTVSTLVNDLFDGRIKNTYFSLPVVVNRKGVKYILPLKYSDDEVDQIVKSANILSKQYEIIEEHLANKK